MGICLQGTTTPKPHRLRVRSLDPSEEKSNKAYEYRTERLVEALPASLESFKLVGSVPWKGLKAFTLQSFSTQG